MKCIEPASKDAQKPEEGSPTNRNSISKGSGRDSVGGVPGARRKQKLDLRRGLLEPPVTPGPHAQRNTCLLIKSLVLCRMGCAQNF